MIRVHIKGSQDDAKQRALEHNVPLTIVSESSDGYGVYGDVEDPHLPKLIEWYCEERGNAPFPPGTLLFYSQSFTSPSLDDIFNEAEKNGLILSGLFQNYKVGGQSHWWAEWSRKRPDGLGTFGNACAKAPTLRDALQEAAKLALQKLPPEDPVQAIRKIQMTTNHALIQNESLRKADLDALLEELTSELEKGR